MAAAVKSRRRARINRKPIHTNGTAPAPVRELIGRHAYANMQIYRNRIAPLTVDRTIPDYEFWDRLRRGKAKGYTLGSLFAKRIERILAGWIIGQDLAVTLAESGDPDSETDPRNYTDNELAKFLLREFVTIHDAKRDALGLGDQYLVVNADGSLSVPSPETVEVVYNPLDYRQVEAVIITTKLEKYTIIDEYRADGRTVTIRTMGANGVQPTEQVIEYANLIGRIPVVHIANGRSGNETHGHPIHEQLKPLYDEYDDIMYKQLDGARLLGNPIMAFVGMEDLEAVKNANQPATASSYTDKDGNVVTQPQLNIDANAAILVGKGGDAKFVSPPVGFTDDTKMALKSLFLLLLDHTGIPEFIWGNELTSSRSTAEVQMTQWTMDIKGQRRSDEKWLLDLCAIWLATIALIDPRMVVDELEVEWPELLGDDKEILLKFLEFCKTHNLLTDKTALELTELVEDAAKEVQEATKEADERREKEFADGSTTGFQNRLASDSRGDE